MPTLQLTVPKNDLTDNEKSQLINRLTETVGNFYEKEKDEQIQEFINVQIRETTKNGYAIGGDIIG
ncbi:hypothetical protein [Fodinibius halophilus]|uniref:4-oxalocrotonate tautomerase n=1 Tax=Fodinibius halophilus TaxID=1736908 RepID=A0A6M1TA06_9BACT|nr:hypothetical protein [Fodinibius halophilus]NGP87784.1 hypothetical protein [Fodinibius halophilus]